MLKKVLKMLVALILIGTFVIVISAIIRQESYPREVTKPLNNEVISSYAEKTGEMPLAYTHKRIDDFDYRGVFQADYLVYIPKINQVQISVRYGTLLFEALKEEYELLDIPTTENPNVSFKLRAMELVDGAFSNGDTVLDENDILDECIIEKSTSLDISSGRHNYSRFVFDGVDFGKYNCLYIDLYYKDEAEPFTSLIIYHTDATAKAKEVKLK